MQQFKVEDLVQDGRGRLVQVTSKGTWRQLNIITRKRGALGGGHYHRSTREFFYVLDGSLILKIMVVPDGSQISYRFQKDDCFEVVPGEQHYMQFVDDTILVVLYSKAFDPENPDTLVEKRLPGLKELFDD